MHADAALKPAKAALAKEAAAINTFVAAKKEGIALLRMLEGE